VGKYVLSAAKPLVQSLAPHTPYLENTQRKKGLAEWLKWKSLPSKRETLSSNASTIKNRKKKKKRKKEKKKRNRELGEDGCLQAKEFQRLLEARRDLEQSLPSQLSEGTNPAMRK
jgi:hypothetical protein